ncbi:hypothetical protein RD792_008883 [Penstemon davidsonii]|uniref:Glycolipid transfer protein domain-containing protein n=1 Tax=Penstemon davidsonii TaxID=160366 RepID=A0ABR0DAC6_9LAMI|nr:hypothetical protein RD792_008883 [Penstemon davidsonii]
MAFASALETFSGGHNDPISVAFGGPDMAKFAIALTEIGTYKEVLRSQVEHVLNDKLIQFADVDLHEVKEARKRFDKANVIYDQSCKGRPEDYLTGTDKRRINTTLSYFLNLFTISEGSRKVSIIKEKFEVGHRQCLRGERRSRNFTMQDQLLSKHALIWYVSALSVVEAKKRFEFLEAVGNTMDAHLRYFKQVFI